MHKKMVTSKNGVGVEIIRVTYTGSFKKRCNVKNNRQKNNLGRFYRYSIGKWLDWI
jgi:hypothetical protein